VSQVEGYLFMLTLPFVGFTGFAFTKQWFRRLDDFNLGVPGPVAPSSALLVELRQRQLIAVLSQSDAHMGDDKRGPGADDSLGGGIGDEAMDDGVEGSGDAALTAGLDRDLTPVDIMYERAMAGPLCGPLLRLFLAQYIRCVAARPIFCSLGVVQVCCRHSMLIREPVDVGV
jgi:hypothetical protein